MCNAFQQSRTQGGFLEYAHSIFRLSNKARGNNLTFEVIKLKTSQIEKIE